MNPRLITIACLSAALAVSACAQRPIASQAAEPGTAVEPPSRSRVTPAQEVGAVLRNQIEIRFTSGSDRLAPDAAQQLDTAVRLFRDVRPVAMFSVGYSDAVGSEFDNLLLAARRARTVKAALVARGIPADRILLRSYGQSDPVDAAAPDAAENRRVLVTWRIL